MTEHRPAHLGSRGLVVAGLVAVWTFGWGEISVGNVVSGVAVALLVLALFPLPASGGGDHHHHTVRPLRVLLLLGWFSREMLESNLQMARDLLGRRDRIRTGVVAYPLRVQSDSLLTFLANVTALTPGAMPIEVDHEPRVLYVHVTRMHQRDRTVAGLARYEELFLRAFGSTEQLAELAAATRAEVRS